MVTPPVAIAPIIIASIAPTITAFVPPTVVLTEALITLL